MLREDIGFSTIPRIYEDRFHTESYCELVFYNKDKEFWNKTLTDIFGPAIKPEGMKPTQDNLSLTKEFLCY